MDNIIQKRTEADRQTHTHTREHTHIHKDKPSDQVNCVKAFVKGMLKYGLCLALIIRKSCLLFNGRISHP